MWIKLIKKLKINIENEDSYFPVFDYGGNKVKIFGTVNLKCFDVKASTERSSGFVVVNDSCEPLLGLKSCVEFGLIKILDAGTVACLPQTEKEFLEGNRDFFKG